MKEPGQKAGGPTFYFDASCDFCNNSASWLDKRVNRGAENLKFQALPDLATDTPLDPSATASDVVAGVASNTAPDSADKTHQPDTARFRQHQDSPPLYGHLAIAAALKSSPNKTDRILAFIIGAKIIDPLAKGVYRLVARNRHKLTA